MAKSNRRVAPATRAAPRRCRAAANRPQCFQTLATRAIAADVAAMRETDATRVIAARRFDPGSYR